MRLFLFTILLSSLCGWTTSAVLAQEPTFPGIPNRIPVYVPAPAASPAPTAKQQQSAAPTAPAVKAVPNAKQQEPVPPVKPTPAPVAKPKVKVKVKDKDFDVDVDNDNEDEGPTEQTFPSTPNVVVSFCGGSSNVTIRGWDRNEVHVTTEGGEKLIVSGDKDTATPGPFSRIEISVSSNSRHGRRGGVCQSNADVQMDVPRSAVLDLKTNEGDVDVENVAKLHAESLNGDFSLRGITRALDATTFSGDISLEKARGPVNLRTISGCIDVRNAAPQDQGDRLSASSVSGDVMISDSSFGQVQLNNVSGGVTWTGALASGGGNYNLSTTNGDITLVMPANSSFKVFAQVANQGAVTTDFLLKAQGETSFKQISQNVSGTYGSGSATLNLSTFNGSIRLRKK